jgi:hypothetical protein
MPSRLATACLTALTDMRIGVARRSTPSAAQDAPPGTRPATQPPPHKLKQPPPQVERPSHR